MNLSLLLFLGIHVVSILTAAVIIFEYRRVQRQRAQIFQHLESAMYPKTEWRLFILVYLISTLLIIVGSAFLFVSKF